ncbi:SH3 domain-containing protein [Azovibrio restrictus]|uniref:SH3 domain-containing protein n=1 Tax=Azovibrio restrictus TaxID=146938 RepID=UPI0026F08F24|nr:SH3 domain-containing protein [Azovibrio restrictus]MDD3482249.1 SH3 domain-containing protein [Azovibrio restrictus]
MVRRLVAALVTGLALSGGASALDYRSVSVPVALFYDVPSAQGKKLFMVKEGTPLEVLVQVEGWTKVRDAEGTIAWIERNALATRRTLVVTAPMADVRQSASAESPLVFQAEKWVILELLEAAPMGWAKVKHRDGATGYVHITQVWGL